MPRYVKFEDIRLRVIGKVRFTENAAEENIMQVTLANNLIDEAESQVELDLSVRYRVPFQGVNGEKFIDLKKAPNYLGTFHVVKTLCELQSVIRILETDFGSGTAINATKYITKLQARYEDILNNRVLKKVQGAEDQNQWFHPPLKGLALAESNSQADDGFRGMVLVASGSRDQGYPAIQINDPAENWWSGVLDDL